MLITIITYCQSKIEKNDFNFNEFKQNGTISLNLVCSLTKNTQNEYQTDIHRLEYLQVNLLG